MSLTRRLRPNRDSLVIAIPGQIASLHDLKPGDGFEWEVLDRGRYRLRRVQEAPR